MAIPTVVAMGGGTFDQPYDPTRERFIFSLARRSRPRIAFLGTASGDSEAYTANFFRSVGALECDATDLPLFQRREADLRHIVLALDIIYVGGGNTLSLLAVWRAHRLDELLREAWEEGIVLCGVSAGMNCWFEQSMTDSFAVGTTQVLDDGLGLLSGSACPHYDEDPTRRPAYRTAVARGEVSPGYAADGAAALVFRDSQLEEVVSWSESATGYHVEPGQNGEATEQALPATRLPPARVRSARRVT